METVPPVIIGHPSVRRNAKRRKKPPGETLLNRSLHHSVMDRIPEGHNRGRPDITNVCLLEALGSPLNKEGRLSIWLHTYGGYSIEVSPEARLPRDCNRFNSLMEQLFMKGMTPPAGGESLMIVNKMALGELIERIGSTRTVALTSHGKPSNLEEVCGILFTEENPVVLIGAFPHGPMSDETLSLADDVMSVHPESFDAWVVTSRLVY